MFGKHFASMYTGSMVGKGPHFFSVWGYVISHFRPSKKHGAIVELNPKVIAMLIGMEEADVQKVINECLSPDPKSRSKDEDGRKLIQLGEYVYVVVNGAHYRAIRDEDHRREYQRDKQREYRAKKKGQPLPGEVSNVRAENNGASVDELDRHTAACLPEEKKAPPVNGSCHESVEASAQELEDAARRAVG